MLKIRIDPHTTSGEISEFEGGELIATDDYYIQRMEDGRDELHFTVQLSDPAYKKIWEEARIIETTENQTYVVKAIDAGSRTADISCQLDLDAWRAEVWIGYNTGGGAVANGIIRAVCPGGWTVNGGWSETKKRSIEMEGPTPLDIVLEVEDRFGYAVRFDTNARTATIIVPGKISQTTAYAVESVNLRKAEFKGKSTDLYTRLYPIGKDGLRIYSVNGEKNYVQNTSYTKQIISKVWIDERYTDPQSLMEDAQAKVDAASQPVRSWELDVVDLHSLNPLEWSGFKMDMFDIILLIDPYREQRHLVQIREQRIYPHHPERNKIYVSTVARSLQRTTGILLRQITDCNSSFFQILKAKIGGSK